MALNKQTFRTRALSAVIFAAIMLIGLLWNQWSFLVLFSIIHFGCWWEFLALIEKIHKTRFHLYTKLGLMVIGYGLMLWFCGAGWTLSGYGIKENLSLPVSAAGFAVLILGIFQKKPIHPKSFLAAFAGLIYISLSWGLLLDLYSVSILWFDNDLPRILPYAGTDNPYILNWSIPVLVIFSIWVNDTMAYIVGSLIGKTPLSKVSPKKTIEGTLGGIFLAVGIAGIIAWLINFDVKTFIIISALASIFGSTGDLLESKLKRSAGEKDSGSMMPGHGGFLDRFDSMLLAVPFVWLYIKCLIL